MVRWLRCVGRLGSAGPCSTGGNGGIRTSGFPGWAIGLRGHHLADLQRSMPGPSKSFWTWCGRTPGWGAPDWQPCFGRSIFTSRRPRFRPTWCDGELEPWRPGCPGSRGGLPTYLDLKQFLESQERNERDCVQLGTFSSMASLLHRGLPGKLLSPRFKMFHFMQKLILKY